MFGGRDDAIGQDLRLGGEPYKIVGVMPPGFVFLNPDIQLFRPAAFTAREKSDESRHSNNWQQFGRLKPGATLEQAQSQLDAINAANLERFPQWREILKNARFSSEVVDFQTNLIGERRSTLTMLWGGAIFVLLIGCVNVANLVLVRSTSRIRELATRHAHGRDLRPAGAPGADRIDGALDRRRRRRPWPRLVGAAAPRRSSASIGCRRASASPSMRRSSASRVLLIAVVGIGVGMIPVVAMRRANMAQVIREEGRSGTQGRGPRLMRRVLVTSQVAFALMLLIGAGVLLASFERVLTIDPGFRAEQRADRHDQPAGVALSR